MKKQSIIHFESLEAVIFDVDGTLYNQKKLRRKMLVSLVISLWKSTNCLKILRVIKSFRSYRERLAQIDANTSLKMQYEWVAKQTDLKVEVVRGIIETWMFKKPLVHISDCLHDGVSELFKILRTKGLKIGIFSDFPAKDKLAAATLNADIYICSTDSSVQRLKPSPKGLLICCEKLNVAPNRALFIGDRDDHDGVCARSANVPFLIIPGGKEAGLQFYQDLIEQFKGLYKRDLSKSLTD